MTVYSPRRILLALFGASAVLFVLEWLALPLAHAPAAVAVYLHVAIASPVVFSAFWSHVNESFNPYAARSAVARIATGGTVGGVLGGLGVWQASAVVSVQAAVLLLAAVNVLCWAGTLALTKLDFANGQAQPADDASLARGGARSLLANSPYLRNLAALVALGAATSAILDYTFSAQVAARYGTGAPLLTFFASFGLAVSVISLLLQLLLGRLAVSKLAPTTTIASLPAAVLLGVAMTLALPSLGSFILLRGVELVQRHSLFRSAYELLYNPVEERQRRAAKGLIDVGFDRLGSVVGSGVALLALALFARPQTILLVAVAGLACATALLVRRLHVGYVAGLKGRLAEANLSRRVTRPIDEQATDALIDEVERARLHDDDDGRLAQALAHGDELRQAVDALLSNDVDRTRAALSDWNRGKLPLVSFGILLLSNDDLHVDARNALRSVANDATGQLLDALHDPSTDFDVRRRIPAVLAVCTSQRAADGLLFGLRDQRFEVRYACVRALMTVAEQAGVTFDRDEIVETIKLQIERATTVFSELDDGAEEQAHPRLDLINRDRMTRSMESVFSLLSLILERDTLRLCLRSLQQENDHQRGTALEYLQTVLPPELRDDLMPLLSEAGPIPAARGAAELLRELTSAPISQVFRSHALFKEKLQACCEELIGMGAAFARIWIFDESRQELQLQASAGLYTHLDGAHARVPLGSFKIGRIGAFQRPHVTNQVLGDAEIPEQAWAEREGLVAFAGYPLMAGERLLGVVALFAQHELSDDMLSALSSMSDQIAKSVDDGAKRGAVHSGSFT